MSNINRDYLIVLNPKTSKVTVPELNYYIYDKYTANLFVNLVTVENGKVVNLPDADQYKLVLHVLKPTNEIQDVENIQVFNKEKALFQIELDAELTKNIGRYKCELLTIDQTDHIVQSAKFSYRVKKSIYNDLDVVTETPQYPIIITLLDKLQDIDKYEEERRANEVARVAAEKARVKDYTDLRKTVTTDIDTMQQKIDSFDGKVQEVDNAVTQMRTNITDYQTKKNTELDNYKTQKDTQINTAIKGMETTIDKYKTEKDTQINDKITQQDNKIDSAIQDQNNTIAANNQAQNKVINDAITEQNKTINTVVENDKKQNDRLDALEYNDTVFITDIEHLQIKDTEHEDRMAAIEAVNVEQNNRLDAIEIKNDQQDGRLNDVEAKNKKQDLDLKCLFAESHSERITLDNEVGNSVFLQNSKQGFATIDELKGNTLVNCNKDTDKELILNGNIDTSGYGTVTTTEGVDGGKVDVALEGNTMVNVCDQEEAVAITKSYTVETGNHIALQGEYDGKCRPNIYGNTMVNLIDTTTFSSGKQWLYLLMLKYSITGKTITIINKADKQTRFQLSYLDGNYKSQTMIPANSMQVVAVDNESEFRMLQGHYDDGWTTDNLDYFKQSIIVLEGDYTNKPIPDYFTGMQSSFEDKLITDEKDAHNGKYKVDYKVTGKNKIDNSKLSLGYVSLSGAFMSGNNNVRTDYIKIMPNTNYIASTSDGFVDNINYGWFDSNKNFIKRNTSNIYVTSPINAKYVILHRATNDDVSITDLSTVHFQLEEGTTATTYEPYKEYTKTLYLNSPLLEGDTIEQSGNDIVHIHRYKTVTFDGSDDEKWVYWGNNTDNGKLDSSLISFYLPFTNYKDFTTSTIFNNKFLMANTVWGATTEIMALNADNIMSFQVALLRSKLATQDLAGFKTWLQQNPITVAYELATPTREVIATKDNLLLDSYVNGHLDVDSVIPIDKVEFRNKGFENKYLNPNTDYIVQFEADNPGKIDYIILGGEHKLNINVTKGINKILCTSGEIENWLDIVGIGFNVSKIVVTPKVEQPFGYFKGMKSVGECEGNKIEILSSKNIALSSNVKYTAKGIEFNFGDKTINENVYVHNISDKSIMVYTSINGKYSRGFMIIKNSKKLIELNEGEVIYCASVNYANGWSNSDVEKARNSFIITKKENEINKKEILLSEPLRGLPNGVKDKYVIIDGKWYIERNTIQLRMDSTFIQNKTLHHYISQDYPDVIGFSTPNNWFKGNSSLVCDNLVYDGHRNINAGSLVSNQEKIFVYDYIFITLNKNKVSTLNEDGFREYLKNNPIILVGQNTTPTYEPIDYNPFEVYTDTTHISNNSNIPCNMVIRNSGFNCMLKPNTTYTVSSNNGLSSVTTKASIGDGILRFYDKDTTSVTKMSKVLVLEGDYITGNPPIPAFFEGMESAFEQELVTDEKDKNYGKYKVNVKAVGKNLLDETKGGINSSMGNSKTICIKVKPNTTYVYSSSKYKDGIAIYQLPFIVGNNTNVQELDSMGYNSSTIRDSQSFTTSGSTNYIFMNYDRASNVQIEQGTKATEYEPYKENNITFYLKEPLRGIGDIKDKVYVKENKVVVERNCVNYVIEPTQIPSWVPSSNGIYTYNLSVNSPIVNTNWGRVVCNSFPCDVKNAHSRNYANSISTVVDQSVPNGVIRIITDKDPETLKQWLQANPTTVIYQLATPTYEEVEYFDLKLFVEIFKDTTIIYNSNIPVTSTINYTYSTPLTDAVNTVSDISDEQDSMIIDMATQVATMEMMLM